MVKNIIEILLVTAFFVLVVIWPLYFLMLLLWFYCQFIISCIKYPFSKKLDKPKIKIESFKSIFETPLYFYFSLPMSAVLLNSLLKMDGSVYSMIINCLLVVLVFWISAYLIFSVLDDRKEIIRITKSHKQFIKVTLLPVGILGIVVPILSVFNMFAEEDYKKGIVLEISKMKIEPNIMYIIFLLILILCIEGLSLVIIGIVNHIYSYEKEYLLFYKEIISLIKNDKNKTQKKR